MSASKILLVVLAVIVGMVLLAGGCVLGGYNRAITLDEGVKNQWAQVENQLQRRFELIPNLLETVKGVAKQEEKIFLGVANARKAYFQANTVNQKAQAAAGFERALSRLLVLREQYPQLKSNQVFPEAPGSARRNREPSGGGAKAVQRPRDRRQHVRPQAAGPLLRGLGGD